MATTNSVAGPTFYGTELARKPKEKEATDETPSPLLSLLPPTHPGVTALPKLLALAVELLPARDFFTRRLPHRPRLRRLRARLRRLARTRPLRPPRQPGRCRR